MKTLFNQKYLFLLCLVITFNSCTTDSIDEINVIQESTTFTNQKSSQNCTRYIVVTYAFTPGMTEFQKNVMRANFRAEMSQYFTICDVKRGTQPECENKELWTVNGFEYDNYLANPPVLKDGTESNNSSDSDAKMQEVPGTVDTSCYDSAPTPPLTDDDGPTETGDDDAFLSDGENMDGFGNNY